MLHVGQQSAFPKVQFITNRMKLETLIREGLERGGRTERPGLTPAPGLDGLPLPDRQQSEYMSATSEINNDALPLQPRDRPHLRNRRRSSVIEEMRRQSAVFFDDTDDSNVYEDTTASEDGSVIVEEAGGTRVG